MIRNMYQQEVSSPLISGDYQMLQKTGNFGSIQVIPQTLFPTSAPSTLAFRRSQNKKLSQIAQQYKSKLEEKKEGEDSPTTKKLKNFQNKYSNSINWLDRVQEKEEQEEVEKKNERIKQNQNKESILQKPVVNNLLAKRAALQGKFNLKLNVVDLGKNS